MALKAITLRLDAEEFEKLKENLSKFGDPDINVGYVLRAYIRDINRAFPLVVASGLDLKSYFGFLGLWLKEVASMTNAEVLTKGMFNWWAHSFPTSPSKEGGVDETVAGKKNRSTARKEGDNKE
jgi:hypothetical protein